MFVAFWTLFLVALLVVIELPEIIEREDAWNAHEFSRWARWQDLTPHPMELPAMSTTPTPNAPTRTHVPPIREAPEIITTLTTRREARRLALARDMLTMRGPYAPNEDDRAFWLREVADALSVLYPDLALSAILGE